MTDTCLVGVGGYRLCETMLLFVARQLRHQFLLLIEKAAEKHSRQTLAEIFNFPVLVTLVGAKGGRQKRHTHAVIAAAAANV